MGGRVGRPRCSLIGWGSLTDLFEPYHFETDAGVGIASPIWPVKNGLQYGLY